MAIPSEAGYQLHSSVSGTGPLSFGFYYSANEDIRVFVTNPDVDFTASDELSSGSFTVTSGPAVAAGFDGGSVTLVSSVTNKDIWVVRDWVRSRSTDLSDASYNASDLNGEFDAIIGMVEDAHRKANSAIQGAPGSSGLGFNYSVSQLNAVVAAYVASSVAIENGIGVADYTELKALTTGQYTTASLAGRTTANDGGGGLFVWISTDQSANVTSDTLEGVYVPPDSDTSGASGAWVRLCDPHVVRIEWFGGAFDSNATTGNGTDNLAAMHAALKQAAAGGAGGKVLLPPGNGRFSSTIVNPYDFVHVQGVGGTSTLIFADHTSAIIQDGSATAFADRNLYSDLFLYQPSGSAYAFDMYYSNTPTLRNVRGEVRNGIKLGNTAVTISGAADNGAGLVRITTGSAHGFVTGTQVRVEGVAGTTEANCSTAGIAHWTITVIDTTTFDLQGSSFSNTYSSGGRVGRRCGGFNLLNSALDCYANYGMSVFTHSGSVSTVGSSLVGKNFTSSIPTSGTFGMYFVKSANAYERFDYIFGMRGISSFARQIYVDNTRVVNLDFNQCLFDHWRDYGIYLKHDSPDETGGGVENFRLSDARFGYNLTAQSTMLRADASGATISGLDMTGAYGDCHETAIELVGGSSTTVSGSFDNMQLNLRPTSGTRHGIAISAKMGLVRAKGLQVTSESATYGGDGINIATGATGDIQYEHVQVSGMGGVAINDVDGIGYGASTPGGRRSGVLNSFTLYIDHSSSVIKHRIGAASSSGDVAAEPSDIIGINGATQTLTTTPNGTDGSTAMANGGKISSASTSVFVFDTGPITATDLKATITEVYNSTGAALAYQGYTSSIDINGETRNRFVIGVTNATSGAAFALNTSNIASGKAIILRVDVTLTPYVAP